MALKDRTLVAIKIRSSKQSRELVQLFLMLLGLFGGIGLIAAAQVLDCKQDHPTKTVRECLRPRGGK